MDDPSRLCRALVRECFEKGLRDTFSSPSAQSGLVEILHAAGCPRGIDRAAAWLLSGLASYGLALGGGRFERALEKLITRTPALNRGFERLLTIVRRCSDEVELKQALLDNLSRDSAISVEAGPHASLSTVNALFSARQFERLSEDLQHGLADLRQAIRGELAEADDFDFYRPDGPRLGDRLFDLDYRVRYDELRGRNPQLAELAGFLGDKSKIGDSNRVGWLMLSGASGVGKSRLALEASRLATLGGWRAGFASHEDLARLSLRPWRPCWDTLILVDDAGEAPENVQAFLQYCAHRAADFEFAVRVVLLERDVEILAERLLARSETGRLLQGAYRGRIALEPLLLDDIVPLMTARIASRGVAPPSRDLLEAIAGEPFHAPGGPQLRATPLLALAASEHYADLSATGDRCGSGTRWTKSTLFESLLASEREARWAEPGRRRGDHDNRLELHENLLWLATFTGGIERGELRGLDPSALDLLPGLALKDPLPIDRERYWRMAGGDPRVRLEPLTPDLLGEFFLLDRLSRQDEAHRQALLGAAFRLGGRAQHQFGNCALNYPDLWRDCGRMAPSRSSRDVALGYLEAVRLLAPFLADRDREQDFRALWQDAAVHIDSMMADGLVPVGQTIFLDPSEPVVNEDGSVSLPGTMAAVISYGAERPGKEAEIKAFMQVFATVDAFLQGEDALVSVQAMAVVEELLGRGREDEARVVLMRLAAKYLGHADLDQARPLVERLWTLRLGASARLASALSAAVRQLALRVDGEERLALLEKLRELAQSVPDPAVLDRLADLCLRFAHTPWVGEILEWLEPLAGELQSRDLLIVAAKLAVDLCDPESGRDRYLAFIEAVVLRGLGDAELEHVWAMLELRCFALRRAQTSELGIAEVHRAVLALGHFAIVHARAGELSEALPYYMERRRLLVRLAPAIGQDAAELQADFDRTMADFGFEPPPDP